MNVKPSRVVLFVLVSYTYLTFACAQNTFSITLDSRRGSTIPTEEIEHQYLLDLPAGVPQVTIRVDAFGDDADLAVYYGEEELYYSIDIDPYPTFTIDNPRAGRYDIYVLNLLMQPLAYEVYVESGSGQGRPTTPSTGSATGTPSTVQIPDQARPVTPTPVTPEPVTPEPVPSATNTAEACPANMTAYRGGSSTLSCTCTAQASQAEGRLWGDGIYTDDSNVCLAARHAGVISTQGGTVTVYPAPGQASYTGSTSNGVTSGSWGSWAGGFRFEVVAAAEPCPANMSAYRDRHDSLTCTCTAQASQAEGRLWGNGIYTDDSNVCLAARHAGVISTQGGTVTVYPAPGQASYTGSTSNGVTSGSWGSWAGSFEFASGHTPAPTAPVNPPSNPPSNPPVGDVANAPTLPVTSSQAATLRNDAGVVLEIPAGAVPRTVTGEVGEMVFSIEPTTVTEDALPQGFTSAGAAYHVGPAGLPLEQPVTLTLPIDPNVDSEAVMGAATFDGSEWVIVPGRVDVAARTVSVITDHLSPWWPIGWSQDDPRLREQGGWLTLENRSRVREYELFEGCRDDPDCNVILPWRQLYGMCLLDYGDLERPIHRFWSTNVRDASRRAIAAPSETLRWWLPNGTYRLETFIHTGQYDNYSPMYIPRYRQYVAPAQVVRVQNGNITALDVLAEEYQEGFSVCFGGSAREQITSVGTGDIQITLTWQANIDVDLYVTDPSGEVIFYGHDSSASGGILDRDNRCSNLEWGRPENIFWHENPPVGTYQIDVDYYGACGDADEAVNWNVRTVINGVPTTYIGTLAPNDRQQVATFTIP